MDNNYNMLYMDLPSKMLSTDVNLDNIRSEILLPSQ